MSLSLLVPEALVPPAGGLQSWISCSPSSLGQGQADDPVVGAFFTSESYILLALEILLPVSEASLPCLVH